MNKHSRKKEKLYAEIRENETICLDWIPSDSHKEFLSYKKPYFKINTPGIYAIDYEIYVKPALQELKKVWARLSDKERNGFLAGLEAARLPVEVFHDEIPF
jgi:hypothetical protein